MKIDKRHAGLVSALIMASVLPFFMTLVVSLVNLGFSERLFSAWMRTWGIASLAAFPLILVFQPLIKRLVGRLVAFGWLVAGAIRIAGAEVLVAIDRWLPLGERAGARSFVGAGVMLVAAAYVYLTSPARRR